MLRLRWLCRLSRATSQHGTRHASTDTISAPTLSSGSGSVLRTRVRALPRATRSTHRHVLRAMVAEVTAQQQAQNRVVLPMLRLCCQHRDGGSMRAVWWHSMQTDAAASEADRNVVTEEGVLRAADMGDVGLVADMITHAPESQRPMLLGVCLERVQDLSQLQQRLLETLPLRPMHEFVSRAVAEKHPGVTANALQHLAALGAEPTREGCDEVLQTVLSTDAVVVGGQNEAGADSAFSSRRARDRLRLASVLVECLDHSSVDEGWAWQSDDGARAAITASASEATGQLIEDNAPRDARVSPSGMEMSVAVRLMDHAARVAQLSASASIASLHQQQRQKPRPGESVSAGSRAAKAAPSPPAGTWFVDDAALMVATRLVSDDHRAEHFASHATPLMLLVLAPALARANRPALARTCLDHAKMEDVDVPAPAVLQTALSLASWGHVLDAAEVFEALCRQVVGSTGKTKQADRVLDEDASLLRDHIVAATDALLTACADVREMQPVEAASAAQIVFRAASHAAGSAVAPDVHSRWLGSMVCACLAAPDKVVQPLWPLASQGELDPSTQCWMVHHALQVGDHTHGEQVASHLQPADFQDARVGPAARQLLERCAETPDLALSRRIARLAIESLDLTDTRPDWLSPKAAAYLLYVLNDGFHDLAEVESGKDLVFAHLPFLKTKQHQKPAGGDIGTEPDSQQPSTSKRRQRRWVELMGTELLLLVAAADSTLQRFGVVVEGLSALLAAADGSEHVDHNRSVAEFFRQTRDTTMVQLAHGLMAERGVRLAPATHTAVIVRASQSDDVSGAMRAFARLLEEHPRGSKEAFTAVVSGFARQGRFDLALQWLRRMQRASVTLDIAAYNVVLQAMSSPEDLKSCDALVHELKTHGLKPNARTAAVVADKFARFGRPQDAQQVLEALQAQGGFDLNPVLVTCWIRALTGSSNTFGLVRSLDEQVVSRGHQRDAPYMEALLRCCARRVAIAETHAIDSDVFWRFDDDERRWVWQGTVAVDEASEHAGEFAESTLRTWQVEAAASFDPAAAVAASGNTSNKSKKAQTTKTRKNTVKVTKAPAWQGKHEQDTLDAIVEKDKSWAGVPSSAGAGGVGGSGMAGDRSSGGADGNNLAGHTTRAMSSGATPHYSMLTPAMVVSLLEICQWRGDGEGALRLWDTACSLHAPELPPPAALLPTIIALGRAGRLEDAIQLHSTYETAKAHIPLRCIKQWIAILGRHRMIDQAMDVYDSVVRQKLKPDHELNRILIEVCGIDPLSVVMKAK